MSIITSLQHPRVKQARALHDPDARRETGSFLAEGLRLIEEAFASGLRCEGFFYTETLTKRPQGQRLLDRARLAKAPLLELSDKVFSSLKETKTSQGAIALFRCPSWSEPWETPLGSGLVVVACQIRDPGNLGTMLRISEAAGARGLLAAKGTVDPYHPKAVRASMGSLFRLPVVMADDIAATFAAERLGSAQIVAAVARGGLAPAAIDLTRPTFLLIGHETEGVPEEWLPPTAIRTTIPMAKAVESLNAAIAASMLLYEVIRQRTTRFSPTPPSPPLRGRG